MDKQTRRVCDKCGYEFDEDELKQGQKEGEEQPDKTMVCPGCGDIVDEDMFFDEKADH